MDKQMLKIQKGFLEDLFDEMLSSEEDLLLVKGGNEKPITCGNGCGMGCGSGCGLNCSGC